MSGKWQVVFTVEPSLQHQVKDLNVTPETLKVLGSLLRNSSGIELSGEAPKGPGNHSRNRQMGFWEDKKGIISGRTDCLQQGEASSPSRTMQTQLSPQSEEGMVYPKAKFEGPQPRNTDAGYTESRVPIW